MTYDGATRFNVTKRLVSLSVQRTDWISTSLSHVSSDVCIPTNILNFLHSKKKVQILSYLFDPRFHLEYPSKCLKPDNELGYMYMREFFFNLLLMVFLFSKGLITLKRGAQAFRRSFFQGIVQVTSSFSKYRNSSFFCSFSAAGTVTFLFLFSFLHPHTR